MTPERIDPSTIPASVLADALRAWARGLYPSEAAVELLLAHDTWTRRGDFLAACVDIAEDAWTQPPADDVDQGDEDRVTHWHNCIECEFSAAGWDAEAVESHQDATGHTIESVKDDDPAPVPLMASVDFEAAARFLRDARCSGSEAAVLRLAISLGQGDLGAALPGLDGRNMAILLDAIAHAAGWHEQGHTALITGISPFGGAL